MFTKFYLTMKNVLFFLSFILIPFLAHGQESSVRDAEERQPDRPQQAVYAELGGRGVVYSLNYDRRFRSVDGLGASAGICVFHVIDISSVFSLPTSVYYLIGKNNNYLELGAGTTFLVKYSGVSMEIHNIDLVLNFTAGYRYQKKRGFIFRAGLTPLISVKNGLSGLPFWLGVSFGHAF
jgi:hypothetical protein